MEESMRKQTPDDLAFLERLTRFEGDDLPADEVASLERELLDDPAKRAALIAHFEHGQRLRTVFQQQACEERIVQFTLPPPGRGQSRRRGWAPVTLASAAALLLFGVAWFLIGSGTPANQPRPVAAPDRSAPLESSDTPPAPPRLVYAQDVAWTGTSPGPLGSGMTNGPWHLASGTVRLEFSDGTRATIRGPASFDATGNKVIKLSRGQLTANNETGKGFTVLAEGKRIANEGTSFGVEARRGHQPEVCVFRGEVTIGGGRRSPVLLAAGSFAPLDEWRRSGVMNASQRRPFQDALVLTCGIEAMEGAVLLFPSDIEHGLMEKEADGKVFLIPERLVHAEKPLRVSLVGPGSLSDRNLAEQIEWHPSMPLRSYLLHASPATRIRRQGPSSFEGSVTFEHPIEAIIVSSRLLNASEGMFAAPPRNPPDPGRGLEPEHVWAIDARGRPASDEVMVSEDRRTLIFNLKVGAGRDQIRVLTSAN